MADLPRPTDPSRPTNPKRSSRCEQAFTSVRGLSHCVRHWPRDGGPPVFLLHGLLDTGASFAPMADTLRQSADLVAPDWRGHGDSERAPNGYWFPDYVADLEGLIDALVGNQQVALVGHSMGGQIASLYAGLRPERVAHLICLDSLNVPATAPETMPRRYRDWLAAQSRPPAPRRYQGLDDLARRIHARYPELTAAQVRQLAEDWSRPDDHGGIRLASDPLHRVAFPVAFHPEDYMAVWQQVTAPVLCLDGGQSPASRWIDAAEMQRRRDCFRDVTHDLLPDCGHMLHLEQPATVAARIAQFIGI